jgi:diguanylate cyclase (GGDEF)-like protein/PAS domain S-box-containing protein
MPNILLVENSRTQMFALTRLIQQAGFNLTVLSEHEKAIELLSSVKEGEVDAVVMGWPGRNADMVAKIQEVFATDPLLNTPLIILADDPELGARVWSENRSFTACLAHSNHQGMVESLQRFLGGQSGQEDNAFLNPGENEESLNITILLVDDSKTSRIKFQRLLQSTGHKVVAVDSGQAALEQAKLESIDLIMMDFFMPDMEGSELCRQFQQNPAYKNVPCVVMTGTYLDETIQKSLEAGAVEVVFKSEAEELFLARINSLANQIRLKKFAMAERYRYEAILTSIGDGVYGVDAHGNIKYMNPAGRKMLGFDHEKDFMGLSAQAVIHHTDENGHSLNGNNDPLMVAYRQSQVLDKHETIFWHRKNGQVQVECTVYPLQGRKNQQGSVIAFRDVGRRKQLEKQLFWHATHDPLTRLFNRLRFERALQFETQRIEQHPNEMHSAMLYIDLDRFKYLNDTAGHEAGDKLLVDVAQRLKKSVRAGDVLARLGGDEFAVILRNVDGKIAFNIAESLRKVLEECAYISEEISFKLGCTIGIAMINRGKTPKDVMVNADIACNAAKLRGRNQSYLFNEHKDTDKTKLSEEIGWSTRLNDALKHNGFKLFYQPILPLAEIDFEMLPDHPSKLWTALSHLPEHYEVLLRLEDNGEYISPYAFMNVAERFNLMQSIDLWVMRTALARLEELQQDGRDINFSINLSGSTLNDPDALDQISSMVEQYQVRPGSILFEITETSAIEKLEEARNFIESMRAKGWRFALDDFGTGFSSFSQLKDLPVDVVKIDGQFVQDMAYDPIDRAIVVAINDIAHSLGIETIAEYVEDAEILRMLNLCGVNHAQGYYIAKPLMDVEQRAENTVMLRLVEPLSGT